MVDDPAASKPLEYEETPIIEPAKELAPPQSGVKETLGNIILFAALFVAGVGASMLLRQYLSSVPEQKQVDKNLSPTISTTPEPAVSTEPFANWNTYQVISGTTKQPVAGVSFKLPPDILAPICDGPTCASQGTYLPGGTRLTVAARGRGQLLPLVGNAIVTDVGGRVFTMQESTVATGSSAPAREFSGLFTGTTGGGYAFAQMRGVIIPGGEGFELELNHFTPTGVAADFAGDDRLFDQILKTVEQS